ncbi:MAG: sodium:proton antiporter [Leptolyngbya foveolarum]|uniref:Sodium:proton antiporter n=1 Tax=Leptolyngbya foveolarum TaxID=47253 RepID=A0A2W4U1F7_9CYAN|nr:MAG: sodium:proton antiporter [Leptolyngbya foveolarum]
MPILLAETFAKTLGSPTATFGLLLAIALIIPPFFERLRLPGLVGLIAAGVLFGSSALGWLDPKDETVILFADIGKLYLMFVAGLEIDLVLFNKTKNRSLSFGVLTFIVPFLSGVAIGLFFDYGWLAAALIGSLLASHTLLAYPIVQRLGVVGDEAVTVTVGATIFTDIAALVVLAICLGISQGDFTTLKLLTLLGSLSLYTIAVLVGLKQLAKTFFRLTGKDEGNQFLFVLLSLFLAAIIAQLIGVEGIIGAFLAGLAINSVIGDGPVKEKTEFIGSVLFIPMFFIDMGLLLDLSAFGSLFRTFQIPLAIITALLASKFLASFGTKLLFGYSWPQTWTMWSLSVPQVAATLAAALVGYQADIITAPVFNSVILLMLTTSILGPLITAQSARYIAITETLTEPEPLSWLPIPEDIAQESSPFTIVVPVYNPKTERWLIELAAIIAQYERGRILPLAVALTQSQMDSPQMRRAIAHCQRRLKDAELISNSFDIPIEPNLRIEHSIPQAIYHLSREQNASLIMMGMRSPTGFASNYAFNPVHTDVMWAAHCPVVVSKLLKPPADLKNILLPIENPSPLTVRVMRFAQVLAAANQGRVTMLHVCSPFSSETHRTRLQKQLETLITQLPVSDCNIEVQVVMRDGVVTAIAKAARHYDAVILRSQRHRTQPGFNLGSLAAPIISRITTSVILIGEPHPDRLRSSPQARSDR